MKHKINLPTKITISRIFLAVILILSIFILYFLDLYGIFEISSMNIWINKDKNIYVNGVLLIFFFVFLIASLTDTLDGYLARKNNQITDLGKFLDPLADKMLINTLMIFLSINFTSLTKLNDLSNNSEKTMVFPFFLVILMVLRDLVVDGLRVIAANKNKVIAANIFGKLKTVTQMIAISIVLLNGFPFFYFDIEFISFLHISDIFCYIATFFSLLSGIIYLKDNYKVLLDD